MSSSPSDPLGVAYETPLRDAVRINLTEWTKCALGRQDQEPAAHHHLLIRELEEISNGTNPRLMVLMPPGTAKSTYASVLFPAWWFAQHPGSAVIGASHTAELAEDFSGRVQGFVTEHAGALGYGLRTENRALWETTNGSRYRAAGVGGSFTPDSQLESFMSDELDQITGAQIRAARAFLR